MGYPSDVASLMSGPHVGVFSPACLNHVAPFDALWDMQHRLTSWQQSQLNSLICERNDTVWIAHFLRVMFAAGEFVKWW